MAQDIGLPEIQLDSASLYREDIFTDRKAGTIRRLIPVTADGATDATRPVLYSGQTQLLTPTGVLPLGFEIEASSLQDAIKKFPGRGQGSARAGDRGGARVSARERLAHRRARCRERHWPEPVQAGARSSFDHGRPALRFRARALVGSAWLRGVWRWRLSGRGRATKEHVGPVALSHRPLAATVVDEYFGTRVRRSLPLASSSSIPPQTRAWVQAENELSRPFLDALPQREWIKQRLTALRNFPRFGVPVHEGERYFFTYNTGLQNHAVLYVADALAGGRSIAARRARPARREYAAGRRDRRTDGVHTRSAGTTRGLRALGCGQRLDQLARARCR